MSYFHASLSSSCSFHTHHIIFASHHTSFSCAAIDLLAEHGIMKPPEMQGLTDEQITELKLVDEWSKISVPSGGVQVNIDEIGRRTGNG